MAASFDQVELLGKALRTHNPLYAERRLSDEEKFGSLVKTLPTQYKRIVMEIYNDHESESEEAKRHTTMFPVVTTGKAIQLSVLESFQFLYDIPKENSLSLR